MNTAAWIFAAAFLVALFLLAVAVGGNADLAAENRRLRKQVRSLQPRDAYAELAKAHPFVVLDLAIHRLRPVERLSLDAQMTAELQAMLDNEGHGNG